MSAAGGVLLYRGGCAKCRALSKLVAWLSRDRLERIPFDSARAEPYLRRHPEARGKLALVSAGRLATGRLALVQAARHVALAWRPW